MGEGLTPLVSLDPSNPDVLVKVDYAMPTLSFKDRGAAVLVAAAVTAGAKRLVQDSSGNAGASVAAYAARAGMACDIFVPASTSPRKVAQIEAYGAKATLVPGTREDTAAAALEAATAGARNGTTFYASHVYNPLFYQGTKTYVYEIWESLGGRLPDTLYLPLGNGTLVLGACTAVHDLERLGLLSRRPKLVAVQASGCAPVHKAYASGSTVVEPVVNMGTAAEGIAIAAPMRGSLVLTALRALGGEVVTAPEDGIHAARHALAARGFFVETTSAATFAAFFGRVSAGLDEGVVVLPLCGAGLKSL
jgi:threonine synthase